MLIRIGGGLLVLVLLILVLKGTIFGGGDGNQVASIARPGSIPTATPPANLPDPLLLGQAQSSGGSGTGSTTTASGGTYTVKSGDTLGGIASALGIAADAQAQWIADVLRLNGMADARTLAVGQELTLPASAASAQPTRTASPSATTTGASGTPAPTRTAGAGGGGGSYTVVDGDYPLLIASKCGVADAQQSSWADQLLSINNKTANNLAVGDVLSLPSGTGSCTTSAAPAATSTRTP